MIRPGRLWWLLRRDLRRGWNASWHNYRTLPRIAGWHWPFWNESVQEVPVHVLTGAQDWRLAAWMLASWFHYSGEGWPVVIHDDGTLPAEARQTFAGMFPTVRFIARAEADAAMAVALAPFPFCAEYRAMHPLAMKIFDVPHFATADRLLVLDSDVLFFGKPQEILDWVASGDGECWFNEDVAESALISEAEARTELGVELRPKVNSGLCLIHRPALDLAFCEQALARTAILRGRVWRIEQTLFALCASRGGKGGLLPPKYEVSLGRHAAAGAVARHYVGAVRDRFYGEGLPRLAGVLLDGN